MKAATESVWDYPRPPRLEGSDRHLTVALDGLILAVYGVVVIGLVDNILRPILVGRDTKMPDYLILLSTLGGLAMVGITGFVLGPVVAALFLACWQMFTEESGGDVPATLEEVRPASAKEA